MDIESIRRMRRLLRAIVLAFFPCLLMLTIFAFLIGNQPNVQAAPVTISVGLITDETGVADGGFNQLAYQGLQRAVTNLGVTGTVYEPANSGEYELKVQQCVSDGNDLCIGVGFLLTDAIYNAAVINSGVKFAGLDTFFPSFPANLRSNSFAYREMGYLAGTLAGLMTASDTIGDIGGMEIFAVIELVEGHRNGAQCANMNIEVLEQYSGSWFDPNLGADIAQDMIAQSADVIFAPAGYTGVGAVLSAAQSGEWVIGVDVDQYHTVFGSGTVAGSEKILSSVVKRVDNAVYLDIQDAIADEFTSGEYWMNLENEGIALAPYHEADSAIPQAVKHQLALTQQNIIVGIVDVNDTCRNYLYIPVVENSAE